VLSLTALVGVLLLGVLPGLIVAAALSLVLLIRLLSRPSLGTLGRDPATGVWGRLDRHPGAEPAAGVTVVRSDGPLFYANIVYVREWILATAGAAGSRAVVIDLSTAGDLDVETLDTLAELADALRKRGVALRLASVLAPARGGLERSGLAARVAIAPTIDDAVSADGPRTPSPSRPSR